MNEFENKKLAEYVPVEAPLKNHIPQVPVQKVSNVTQETEFTKVIDDIKIQTVNNAAAEDVKFKQDFKDKLKEATLKLAEFERQKAELEKQNVEFNQELLETQQKLNTYQQEEDKWDNRRKKRQYHYDGVKDIMLCIGIKNPMCIPVMYMLLPIAAVAFLAKALLIATFGNLLCGAVDSDRPKAMRGFLWTVLVFACMIILGVGIYLGITELVPYIQSL